MSLELNNGKYMKLCDWVSFDKLNWNGLSRNPNAIHILERNLDKIDWFSLAINPNIFHPKLI